MMTFKLKMRFKKSSELGLMKWSMISWVHWKSVGNGMVPTTADFLSIRHIRGQLPQELVDAYDKFQEQVDKYLSLIQARKALEKEERRKRKRNMLKAHLRI